MQNFRRASPPLSYAEFPPPRGFSSLLTFTQESWILFTVVVSTDLSVDIAVDSRSILGRHIPDKQVPPLPLLVFDHNIVPNKYSLSNFLALPAGRTSHFRTFRSSCLCPFWSEEWDTNRRLQLSLAVVPRCSTGNLVPRSLVFLSTCGRVTHVQFSTSIGSAESIGRWKVVS